MPNSSLTFSMSLLLQKPSMSAPFHGVDQQNVHQDGQLFDTKAVLEPIHRQLNGLEKNLEENLERQLIAMVAGFETVLQRQLQALLTGFDTMLQRQQETFDTMLQRQQETFVSALKDVQSEVALVKLAMEARNEEGHSPFANALEMMESEVKSLTEKK
jgi:hypothetical protein